MDHVAYPPGSYDHLTRPTMFLAGTIDNGSSVDWQAEAAKYAVSIGFSVLNPRRPDWDPKTEQSITNPKFYAQVNWELNALTDADCVIINFLRDSQSPISLLELGLFASRSRLIVVCPEGFWRKGNVDIVCQRGGIPQALDVNTAIDFLHEVFIHKD